MKKVNVITLGCSKNLVDSELLMKQFAVAGYRVTADDSAPDVATPDVATPDVTIPDVADPDGATPNTNSETPNAGREGGNANSKTPEISVEGRSSNSDGAWTDVVVVNTCGFIGDAKEESVNVILEQVELKREGRIGKLFVMGCLAERYGEELRREIPEMDGLFGKFDWRGILDALNEQYSAECRNARLLTTPPHYAYLKISEGCNRNCSYCAIPIMTGHYVSRPMEEIIDETKRLVAGGVKELLVMAQDLTYYGIDLYKENRLAELVARLSDVKGIEWIKLHYAYPAGFPLELLTVMRERENVCKYLDIALQHSSDNMLTMMRRGITKRETEELLATIREKVPGIYIRTTMMVGHPGESEEDFEELLEFIKSQRFERLGVFAYSHEEGTWCDTHYKDDIPSRVKRSRVAKLMAAQCKISRELNESEVGKVKRVIIDRWEGDFWIGRTEHDSPEVDPEVLVSSHKTLTIGDFYDVEITDAEDYDLYGKIIFR